MVPELFTWEWRRRRAARRAESLREGSGQAAAGLRLGYFFSGDGVGGRGRRGAGTRGAPLATCDSCLPENEEGDDDVICFRL